MGRQARTLRVGETSLEVDPLTGLSSGKITLSNYGVSNLASTAATEYVLDPPVEGIRKTLYSVTTTSAAVVVRGSTGTSVKFGNQGATQLTFAATHAMVVELLGLNSTQWLISGHFMAADTTGLVVAST